MQLTCGSDTVRADFFGSSGRIRTYNPSVLPVLRWARSGPGDNRNRTQHGDSHWFARRGSPGLILGICCCRISDIAALARNRPLRSNSVPGLCRQEHPSRWNTTLRSPSSRRSGTAGLHRQFRRIGVRVHRARNGIYVLLNSARRVKASGTVSVYVDRLKRCSPNPHPVFTGAFANAPQKFARLPCPFSSGWFTVLGNRRVYRPLLRRTVFERRRVSISVRASQGDQTDNGRRI